MQEYVRDQYCSIDALHILRSICVTGGISGGATRKFGASKRRNYRAHRRISAQYIGLILHIILKYSLAKISWSELGKLKRSILPN